MTAPLHAQLYFPPTNSSTWETTDPSTLGWCQPKIDSLYHFLEANSTKAFILLKDGKIVLEKYFNGHSATNNWYWASAGKTLTSTLVGLAQQDNKLNISDLSSKYLGSGWTSCTPTQENKITIRHQLTMTSGLNDALADPYCTTNTCLQYKADAGTRWAYHNAPEHIKKERKKPANTPTAKALEVSTKLTKTLGLNEVQQKDLHAAILDYETNVTNVNKSNLSKKDKYNKIHTLNMKRQARLKAILTPEQYKTYILSFP